MWSISLWKLCIRNITSVCVRLFATHNKSNQIPKEGGKTCNIQKDDLFIMYGGHNTGTMCKM